MKIKTRKKQSSKKILLAIVVIVLLCSGGVLYAYFQKVGPFSSPATPKQTTTSVNYDPPTDQEVSSSQDAKKNLPVTPDPDSPTTTPSPNTKQDPPSKKATNVGISYADVYNGKLEIRAFTNTVIEGTGTCTATVTMKGMESSRVTKSSKAFIDASSTVCEPLYIPVTELYAGTWQVSVKFSSPDREGTSEVVEVKVP